MTDFLVLRQCVELYDGDCNINGVHLGLVKDAGAFGTKTYITANGVKICTPRSPFVSSNSVEALVIKDFLKNVTVLTEKQCSQLRFTVMNKWLPLSKEMDIPAGEETFMITEGMVRVICPVNVEQESILCYQADSDAMVIIMSPGIKCAVVYKLDKIDAIGTMLEKFQQYIPETMKKLAPVMD